MAVGTSVGEEDLRVTLAGRSGLDEASLWYPVHEVPRVFGVSWPLTCDRAEDVLSALLDGLRRTLPPPDEPPCSRGRSSPLWGCAMSMRGVEHGVVPAETAAVARRAFPKGSLAIRVRDELGCPLLFRPAGTVIAADSTHLVLAH